MVYIKRKIIKHGPSSYIVSLPLKWVKKFNISKGDEVSVEEKGNEIVISSSYKDAHEVAEFNLKDTKEITPGVIHALYDRGIEEIKINYNDPEEFAIILKTLERQEIGYEIVETTTSSCIIRTITRLTKEFDLVLRRTFLVTISLAEEGIKSIKEKNFSSLSIITSLEKSNNKFTTFCRRYLNKYGSENYDRIGPLYFIVEVLEKIADEYRNLFDDLSALDVNKVNINKKLLQTFDTINKMLRLFYECFYKFEYNKIRKIIEYRMQIINVLKQEAKNVKTEDSVFMYQHATLLNAMISGMIEPYLVLSIKK